MDLGATVCTRSSPGCSGCPLKRDCKALSAGRIAELPSSRPRKSLPVKSTRMLLLRNPSGEVLLEKRPPAGIWGGLWSLPEAGLDECVETLCRQRWGFCVGQMKDGTEFRHTFSHYHLDITPCSVVLADSAMQIREPGAQKWCNREDFQNHALATPVASLLREYLES